MTVTYTPEQIKDYGYDWLATWIGVPSFYCWQMVIGLHSGQDFAQMRTVRIDASRDLWAIVRRKDLPVKPYKCHALLP